MNFFLYLILLFFIINPSLSYDAIDLNNPSSVEIVPKKILKKDTQYYLGIKINLYDGWKTYWKNPGDSGLPLSIEWEKKCDLVLSMGTSMCGMNADRVFTTCSTKALKQNPGAIGGVIINLQWIRWQK